MKKQTLEQYVRAAHTKQTADNYLYVIINFLSIHPDARKFQYMDLVQYFDQLTIRYPKVATRIRMLAAIKKYYDFLLHTGRRIDHPCRKLIIKRKKTAIQTQDLFSMNELQLLYTRPNRYKNLDVRDRVLFSFLLQQALSSHELAELNITNIDLDKGEVHIKASAKISGRILPLDVSQIALLIRYLNETRPAMIKAKTSKLIISKAGGGMSVDSIHAVFEPLRMLFPGRTMNPERIRMSVISYWLNDRKMPVEQVMELSGLKWASSVMQYKKIDIAEQSKLINRFHPLR